MKRPVDAIPFCRSDLLKNCGFNLLNYKIVSIRLSSFPVDAHDKLTINCGDEIDQASAFIYSPLCGLDAIGFACACAAERGGKQVVYGYSQAVLQPVNNVTVASIWLALSAAYLVAKIKLRAEKDFISYGCFYDNDFIDVRDYIESIEIDSEIKSKIYNDFIGGDFVSLSATLDYYSMSKEQEVKPWLGSWSALSHNMWRFPYESMIISSSLDARYLCGATDIPKIGYGNIKDCDFNLPRSGWTQRAFDPVSAALRGHCAYKMHSLSKVFAHKNGIFSIPKHKHEAIAELWNEMADLSSSLVSERIRWDASKMAIKSWYASKLRKYGHGSAR